MEIGESPISEERQIWWFWELQANQLHFGSWEAGTKNVEQILL